MSNPNHSDDLKWLHWTGYAEGFSFLVLLLIAMPLKYLFGVPQAVRVVGMAHGVLFIAYVVLVLVTARNHSWPGGLTGQGLLAGLLPAGPFWFDRKLKSLQAQKRA